VKDVTPWEDASGGKVIECPWPATCTAIMRYAGAPGRYTLRVEYFDLNDGERLRVSIGDRIIETWDAHIPLPTKKVDSTSSTRHTIHNVELHTGDEIRIQSTRPGVDYIELLPE
jgi:hypothetical protein